MIRKTFLKRLVKYSLNCVSSSLHKIFTDHHGRLIVTDGRSAYRFTLEMTSDQAYCSADLLKALPAMSSTDLSPKALDNYPAEHNQMICDMVERHIATSLASAAPGSSVSFKISDLKVLLELASESSDKVTITLPVSNEVKPYFRFVGGEAIICSVKD